MNSSNGRFSSLRGRESEDDYSSKPGWANIKDVNPKPTLHSVRSNSITLVKAESTKSLSQTIYREKALQSTTVYVKQLSPLKQRVQIKAPILPTIITNKEGDREAKFK